MLIVDALKKEYGRRIRVLTKACDVIDLLYLRPPQKRIKIKG